MAQSLISRSGMKIWHIAILLLCLGTAPAGAQGLWAGGSRETYITSQRERLAGIPGTAIERVDARTLLVHFDSDVLFLPGSAALDGGGRAALAEAAGVITQFHLTAVEVQGHTDGIGSGERNQILSRQRARAVASFLIGQGVDPERITAVGLGDSRPLASNGTPDGRRQNRRVDLLLRAPDLPAGGLR